MLDVKIDSTKKTVKKVASSTTKTILTILGGMGEIAAQQQKLREEETIAHMRGQRHNNSMCALCKESE